MQQPFGVQLTRLLNVQLAIGGVRTRIISADSELALTVPPAVARFSVDGQEPCDIKVHAQWASSQPPITGRLVFDSGGLWRLHEDGEKLCWSFTSPRFGVTPYKTAIFDRDFSAGDIYLHRPYFDVSAPIYPMEYPLDELVVTNWLARGRGIEMHSCGVRDADGNGYLFCGHSGAGKTTIARLWKDLSGVDVLSDDRIVLRREGDRLFMYGTPWHGDEPLAAPMRASVSKIFVLHHASHNRSVDLGAADAIAALLARSFPPFFNAAALDFTMSFLEDVVGRVPCVDLGFVPDDRLPEFVRQHWSVFVL